MRAFAVSTVGSRSDACRMAVAATGGDGGVLVVVSASGKIAWSVEVGVCAPGGMVRDLPRILRAVAELLERDRGVGKEKRRRSR